MMRPTGVWLPPRKRSRFEAPSGTADGFGNSAFILMETIMIKTILGAAAVLALASGTAYAGNISIVNQSGWHNDQQTFQAGSNYSAIDQSGKTNWAGVEQYGLGNAQATVQVGKSNEGYTNQFGLGNESLTTQFGKSNASGTWQTGLGNGSSTTQLGHGNYSETSQSGVGNTSSTVQVNF